MTGWASRVLGWSSRTGPRMAATALLCALPVVIYAALELPLVDHLVLSLALMATGLAISRRLPAWRLVVALLSVAASARYIWWRAEDTLYLEWTADGAASVALLAAEMFGFFLLVTGYFQTAFTRPRVPRPLPDDPAQLPWVDVYVPTYNEDIDIVRRTLVGAVSLDYPKKRVWLLDEKRRPEMRALCEELGAGWITRPDNRGAKAGNLNHAMTETRGELVAVFDADQVPVRSFLRVTVGFFLDNPRLALVQTPHHFYNPDPFERNLYVEEIIPSEQVMFYRVIQVGNDFWNSSFFCGSCAVLRRAALDDVGGIAQETVTEDAHTALKMHARGWDSAYLAIPQAAGLATERYGYYVSQRIRWARGMIQILRLDNPLFKRGLTWAQRFNYFNAACHFLFGIPRVVYLLAPPLWLVFGLHPLDASALDIAAYALPHVFLSVVGGSAISQSARHSFWAEVYETAIAPYIAWVTVLTLLAPRHGKFNVTTKGAQFDQQEFDWRHAMPNLVIGALVLAAFIATPIRFAMQPDDRGTALLAGFWNLYNGVTLLAAILVALDRRQRRRVYRVRRWNRVTVEDASGATATQWRGRLVDMSEDGLRMRLPELGSSLPERLRLTIASDFGAPFTLPATTLDVDAEGGSSLVRVRFDALAPAETRHVIEQMFVPANAWIYQSPPPDRPLRSMGEILRAPWVALRGTAHPGAP